MYSYNELNQRLHRTVKLIELRDDYALDILADAGWSDVHINSFRVWGCLEKNVVPCPLPVDVIESASEKLEYRSLRRHDLSWKERVGMKFDKVMHNLSTRSTIEIAGIKIPEPNRGIVVVGNQRSFSQDSHRVLRTRLIVRALLAQYSRQGSDVYCCDSSTGPLPDYCLGKSFVLSVEDFVGFKDKDQLLELIQTARPNEVSPVIGIPHFNPEDSQVRVLLSSVKTWILASSDAATAKWFSQKLGPEYQSIRLFGLRRNAFWVVFNAVQKSRGFYGELR